MVLDERARHELYLRLEATIGTEAATTLMELLPPVGWAAHYDPCQWFWTIPDDREPGYAYWAVEMYGTGKGHSVWTLNGLEVDSHRAEGSAGQDWVDWDPGADASTNCHSQSVSVSYGGVGLGVDKQHCEMWDIDKGEDGADMSNWWRGHVRRKERETAAMTVTRLAEGRAPRNAFDFDFYANP